MSFGLRRERQPHDSAYSVLVIATDVRGPLVPAEIEPATKPVERIKPADGCEIHRVAAPEEEAGRRHGRDVIAVDPGGIADVQAQASGGVVFNDDRAAVEKVVGVGIVEGEIDVAVAAR